MKNLKHILIVTLLVLFATSCDNGIDGITQVSPGEDASAPQITIKYPTEGTAIKVFEEVTDLDVEFEVTDDIELQEVSVLLDGSEIAHFNDFKDYRRLLEKFIYDNLVDGDHKLTVSATDIESNTSTVEVNFSKEPPYSPQFDGELLYMPFDGSYMDLIGFQEATKVGTPGFSGSGYVGSDSYRGATDSYLTFPLEGLANAEFSAAFWYKVDSNPDRGGILTVGNDTPENRKQGFRLFREGSPTEQRIKLNVGFGADESWNDGGVIDVTAGDWVHVAFTISETKSTIYFNGVEMLSANMAAAIDWTGCELLSIGSGAPTFDYWNHKSDSSDIDELRVFDKELSQSEIQIMINSLNPYMPKYAGESFYMPFDGDYIDLVGSAAATQIGTPDFTVDSYEGSNAYLGATDSYLSYPAGDLVSSEFSAAFWYKVDASPDRAGILTIGNDTPENRNQGFRLFREGNPTEQRIKLNVGTGTGESWNDGDVIDVTTGEWVHITMTISDSKNTIYFNGVEVRSSDMSAPIDWTGCNAFSIGSGAPTFDYWDHKADLSAMDELRFFHKALTPEEVAEVAGGVYTPPNYGSTFYMPFDGNVTEMNNNVEATIVGTPGFAGESNVGTDAFAGAADSYLTFPTNGVFGNEFSGAFWYKVNADPDRAGIITVGPPMDGADNVLTSGFRLFREGSGIEQRLKLHVGTDGGDVWNDGDVIDPTIGDWIHIAFTVSDTATMIYINGVAVANTGDMTGKLVDWTDCDIISIGSGAPRFSAWDHLSDSSYIDDLHLFDRALTEAEIIDIIN